MKALFLFVLLSPAFLADGQNITYKNIRSDVPKRSTEYYVTLPIHGGIKLEVDARFEWNFECTPNYLSCGSKLERTYIGLLTQKDGKEVAFHPEAPADKILDPEILPLVKQWSAKVLQMDKEYIKSSTEFTDESGQRWVKK